MNEKQTHFQPDTIDTQLDELTKLAPLPDADLEVKTVHAVQQVYKNLAAQETTSLDRVFNRFVQHVAHKDELTENQQEGISTQTTTQLKSNLLDVSANAGRIQENYMSMQKQNRSTVRGMGMAIAAVLALALVAGSVVSFLLIANARVAHDPKRITTNPTVQPQFHTSTPIPQPQTTCPAAGTSRVAILPTLTQKVGQSIVYVSAHSEGNNGSFSSAVESYNVSSGQTSEILGPNTSGIDLNFLRISEAHLSSDGQWVVIVAVPLSLTSESFAPEEILLIRIDGQYLQTLYCSSVNQIVSHAYISPDMRSLVFDLAPTKVPTPQELGMYRLDLVNGRSIHKLLTVQSTAASGLIYQPEAWIDNNHVIVSTHNTNYVKDQQGDYDYPPGKVVSLDITQGDNQQIAQLPILLDQTNEYQPFDISPDRSSLVTTKYQKQIINTHVNWYNTGTLIVKNRASGATQTILNREDLPIQSVHMVSNTKILFTVLDASNTRPANNGLWCINTDGTGLTQLVSTPSSTPSTVYLSLDERGQPSAYISNDKSLYIIADASAGSTLGPAIQLSYIPVSGGNLVVVPPHQQITIVLGWTVY